MSEEKQDGAIKAFMDDIVNVCKEHGLWISHEDCHGAFTIDRDSTEEWLRAAYDLGE